MSDGPSASGRAATNHVAGIVLAAGGSARMGSPKALLAYDGRTFVEHAVAALREGGCDGVVVVVGAVTARHLADLGLDLGDAVLLDNPRWAEGPTVSLQCGLARARERWPQLTGVVVHTVDRPRVRPSTVDALLAAHADDPTVVAQPRRDGRSGHPLLWPARSFDALSALEPAQTRRELLRGPAALERRRVAVDDPGIHDNVDHPSALDELV